jgi:hypothetical protein
MGVCEKYAVKGMIKAGATKDQVVKCRKCKGKIKRCVKLRILKRIKIMKTRKRNQKNINR